MSDKAKKVLAVYESAVKAEQREWEDKFHSYELRMARLDGFWNKDKYKEVEKEMSLMYKIHDKYCKGLKVVADMMIEAISE